MHINFKRAVSSIVTTALIGAGIAITAPAANAATNVARDNFDAVNTEIIRLINEERARWDLAPLEFNTAMDNATNAYLTAAVAISPDDVDHNTTKFPALVGCATPAKDKELEIIYGIPSNRFIEANAARETFDAYMNSSEHRSALLSNRVTTYGIHSVLATTGTFTNLINFNQRCGVAAPVFTNKTAVVGEDNGTGRPKGLQINTRFYGKNLKNVKFYLVEPDGTKTLVPTAATQNTPGSSSFETTGMKSRSFNRFVTLAKHGTYKMVVEGWTGYYTTYPNVLQGDANATFVVANVNNPTRVSLSNVSTSAGATFNVNIVNARQRPYSLQASPAGQNAWTTVASGTLGDADTQTFSVTSARPTTAPNMDYRVVARKSPWGGETVSNVTRVQFAPGNAPITASTATARAGEELAVSYTLSQYSNAQGGTVTVSYNGNTYSAPASQNGVVRFPAGSTVGTHNVTLTFSSPVHTVSRTQTTVNVTPRLVTPALTAPSATMDSWNLKSIQPNSNSSLTGSYTYKMGATVLGTVPVGGDTTVILRNKNLLSGTYNLTAVYSGDAKHAPASINYAINVRSAVNNASVAVNGNPYPFNNNVQAFTVNHSSNNSVQAYKVTVQSNTGSGWVNAKSVDVRGSGSFSVNVNIGSAKSVNIRVLVNGVVRGNYTANRLMTSTISNFDAYADSVYGKGFSYKFKVSNAAGAPWTAKISNASTKAQVTTGSGVVDGAGNVLFVTPPKLDPNKYRVEFVVNAPSGKVTASGLFSIEKPTLTHKLSVPTKVVHGKDFNVTVSTTGAPVLSTTGAVLQHYVNKKWTTATTVSRVNKDSSITWKVKASSIGRQQYRVVFQGNTWIKGTITGVGSTSIAKSPRVVSKSWATSKTVTQGKSYTATVKVTAGRYILARKDPGSSKYKTIKTGTAKHNQTLKLALKPTKVGTSTFRLTLSGTSTSNGQTLTSKVKSVKPARVVSKSWATSKTVTHGKSYTATVKVRSGKYTLARKDPGSSKYKTIKTGTAKHNQTLKLALKPTKVGTSTFRLTLSGTSASNGQTLTSKVKSVKPRIVSKSWATSKTVTQGKSYTATVKVRSGRYTLARKDPGSSKYKTIKTGTAKHNQTLKLALKPTKVGTSTFRLTLSGTSTSKAQTLTSKVKSVKSARVVSKSWATSKTVTQGKSYTATVKVRSGKYTLARKDPGSSKYKTIKTGTAKHNQTLKLALKPTKVGTSTFRLTLSGTSTSNGQTLTSKVKSVKPARVVSKSWATSKTVLRGRTYTATVKVKSGKYTLARKDPGSSKYKTIKTGTAKNNQTLKLALKPTKKGTSTFRLTLNGTSAAKGVTLTSKVTMR